jgi:putative SOS response-associated peptidase YedK
MCGRFTLTTTPEELARHFGLDETPVLAPRFNVAPSQAIATVSRTRETARPTLVLRRWGLLPSWAKDPKIAQRMINARAETLAEKPAFRAAFRKRRCLVPADGYYEWAARAGARKQPYHITLSGQRCFGIAGLWESWRDPAGGTLESCTLLTTQSHATLRAVHDRMPVIVDPVDYADWLDPAADADAVLERLLASAASRPLELHPVGRRVNDPRYDGPACLEPMVAGAP